MWGLDGKDESRGAECREACRGFEGLSIFASWMARTAHTNSSPLPVLFSSFIWIGWSGGEFSVFLPEQGFHRLGQCRAVTSHCSFSPNVSAPRSCRAGGLGRSNLFFFLPFAPLIWERHLPRGVGERRWLVSCHPRGDRNRRSLKELEDRMEERISQSGVNLSAWGQGP